MTTVPTTALTVPLEIHGHEGGGAGFLEPLLGVGGFLLVVAVLLLAVMLLRRYGLIPDNLTLMGRRPSPEDNARHLLADRMARGEVSTEEFLERASVLNWTPGSDITSQPRKRYRGRN